jgi:phenylpyruvate tautomerase PptA (4-oxalocrotonate tautomerase family)
MPCIQIKTSGKIPLEKEKIIKEKLGKAIELIPGKSENWLMLCLEGDRRIYFAGTSDERTAFVKVGLFGKASQAAYGRLTQAITEILQSELGIEPSRTYIQYEESQYWGWNGTNL